MFGVGDRQPGPCPKIRHGFLLVEGRLRSTVRGTSVPSARLWTQMNPSDEQIWRVPTQQQASSQR